VIIETPNHRAVSCATPLAIADLNLLAWVREHLPTVPNGSKKGARKPLCLNEPPKETPGPKCAAH
jgi:hypothetical protein